MNPDLKDSPQPPTAPAPKTHTEQAAEREDRADRIAQTVAQGMAKPFQENPNHEVPY
jgi:hypothetical protein